VADWVLLTLALVVVGLGCLAIFQRASGDYEDATETLGVIIIICGFMVLFLIGRGIMTFILWAF